MIRRLAKRQSVRFVSVGASGFLVNLVVLSLLHQVVGWHLVVSQIIAAEVAILSNFTLHHNWTYTDYRQQSVLRRLAKFNASAATGSLITLLVLVVGVHLHLHYLVALVCGALTALVWNFLMNKFIIWRTHTETSPETA